MNFGRAGNRESGMEKLKRRLEVLLGAKQHAPADETQRKRRQQEAERLAYRARR